MPLALLLAVTTSTFRTELPGGGGTGNTLGRWHTRSVRIVKTSERLSMESTLICFACKRRPNPYETFHRCGGCQTVFYFGPECQRDDWKGHKGSCKAAQENRFHENDLLASHGNDVAQYNLGFAMRREMV